MSDKRENEEEFQEEEEQAGEGQADSSQKQCLLCGEVPENIICLHCGHNIDIPCAFKVILESQTVEEPDISKIACLECGEVTDLSHEVQAAIVAYVEGMQEAGLEEGFEEMEGEEEEFGNEEEIFEVKKKRENSISKNNVPSYVKSSVTRGNKESSSNAFQKKSANELKESVSQLNPNDISLHFACLSHPNEEYAYYSASLRKLYCAQCILDERINSQNRDLKSIKRSLPIINQHLQELVTGIESCRGLIGNRKKDAEIKLDDLNVRLNSLRYKAELKFDELSERVLVCKQQFLDNFNQRSSTLLDDVKHHSVQLEEKLHYLDTIIDQITMLQQSENGDEDLLGFYFANQEKISHFLNQDNDLAMMARLRASCDHIENRLQSYMNSEIKLQYDEIIGVARDIFEIKTSTSNHIEASRGARGATDLSFKELLVPSSNSFKKTSFKREEGISKDHKNELFEDGSRDNEGLFIRVPVQQSQSTLSRKYRDSPIQKTEASPFLDNITRTLGSKKPQLSETTAYFEILRDRDARRNLLGETKKAAVVAVGNPFSSLEKKLAMFDVRNPSRPKQNCSTKFSPSDISLHFGRQEKIDLDRSAQYCKHDAPNVESLRFFRQKMRDRLAKDTTGLRRNLFTS